jgi:hypothetical protein
MKLRMPEMPPAMLLDALGSYNLLPAIVSCRRGGAVMKRHRKRRSQLHPKFRLTFSRG